MHHMDKKPLNENEAAVVFEQYKIYLEMADRVNQRRMNANTFFTSVNTLLIAVASLINSEINAWKFFVSFLGLILCFTWYFTLSGYRKLNSVKFKIIQEIEGFLPITGYTDEWKILRSGRKENKYWPLSHIEKIVPIVFFFAYIFIMIYHFIQTINCL